jgi:hypothetical protein
MNLIVLACKSNQIGRIFLGVIGTICAANLIERECFYENAAI